MKLNQEFKSDQSEVEINIEEEEEEKKQCSNYFYYLPQIKLFKYYSRKTKLEILLYDITLANANKIKVETKPVSKQLSILWHTIEDFN